MKQQATKNIILEKQAKRWISNLRSYPIVDPVGSAINSANKSF